MPLWIATARIRSPIYKDTDNIYTAYKYHENENNAREICQKMIKDTVPEAEILELIWNSIPDHIILGMASMIKAKASG